MISRWISLGSIIVNIVLLALVILLSVQNKELKSYPVENEDAMDETTIDIIHGGDTAKAFSVVRIDGMREFVSFDTVNDKRLLFIFTTTCPGCVKNIENWNEIANTASRVRIMGISLHEPLPTLEYLQLHKLNFDVYTMLERQFIREYKIHRVPSTILINNNGVVLKSWVNLLTTEKKQELLTLLGG